MKTPYYQIIKNRPRPTVGKSFGDFLLPLLDSMEVDDSFPFSSVDSARVTALVNTYGKKYKKAFFINVSDEAVCWRTV